MDLGIKGKKAIVCASSKGLGKACAKSLVMEGVDVIINSSNQENLEKTLQELNKNASFHYYEGAKHAFANASGLLYQEIAAEDSWEKTVNFLQAHLD